MKLNTLLLKYILTQYTAELVNNKAFTESKQKSNHTLHKNDKYTMTDYRKTAEWFYNKKRNGWNDSSVHYNILARMESWIFMYKRTD